MPSYFTTSQWIWVDYAIAVVLSVSALTGLIRGFFTQVFTLLLWMVAIWVGFYFSRDFAVLFNNSIVYPPARMAAAFALLFLATLIVGGMVGFILKGLLANPALTATDRLLGLVLGVLRGAMALAILVMLAGLTPLPNEPWWKQSRLIPPFQSLAVWLKDHVPSGLAGYLNYR